MPAGSRSRAAPRAAPQARRSRGGSSRTGFPQAACRSASHPAVPYLFASAHASRPVPDSFALEVEELMVVPRFPKLEVPRSRRAADTRGWDQLSATCPMMRSAENTERPTLDRPALLLGRALRRRVGRTRLARKASIKPMIAFASETALGRTSAMATRRSRRYRPWTAERTIAFAEQHVALAAGLPRDRWS